MGARRDGGTGQVKGRFPDDFSATTARLVCPDVTLADALIQLTLRGAPRPAGTSETGCGAASLPRRRQAARSGRLDCAAARSSSSPVSRSAPVDMSRSTTGSMVGAEAGKVMAVVQTAMVEAMPYFLAHVSSLRASACFCIPILPLLALPRAKLISRFYVGDESLRHSGTRCSL